jgi:hypothetical protein
MRRRPALSSDHDTAATRFAWGAAFFVTIALVAILGMARSAQALTLPTGASAGTAAVLPPPTDQEIEEEVERGEEEEELEVEECEGCEADTESEACLLSSASATVSASSAGDKVRLVVRYTAFVPAVVGVDFWLRGSKGPLTLGKDQKRFETTGVLRLTESLSEEQMTKVMAARDFTVKLRPVNAPSYCDRRFDKHLTFKHTAPGGLTWSDSESAPRTSVRR